MNEDCKTAELFFSDDKNDLNKAEEYLATVRDDSSIWNAIDCNALMRIMDFSKYEEYPLIKKILRKRLLAYERTSDGNYFNPTFSTERLIISGFRRRSFDSMIQRVQRDSSFKLANLTELSDYDFLENFVNGINRYEILSKWYEPVGIIGVEPYSKYWSFGYYILPEFRRQGYAYEACSCIIRNIFDGSIVDIIPTKYDDVYRRNRICSKPLRLDSYKTNEPSCRLIEKLGFVKISEDEQYVYYELSAKKNRSQH